MCESYNRQYLRDYRTVIPSNLYGPGDNFNLNNAHVIPALIRKMHEAKLRNLKSVSIWGDGLLKNSYILKTWQKLVFL